MVYIAQAESILSTAILKILPRGLHKYPPLPPLEWLGVVSRILTLTGVGERSGLEVDCKTKRGETDVIPGGWRKPRDCLLKVADP